MTELHDITVCICTYKRPELLEVLLSTLAAQEIEAPFVFSVVVVDNDAAQSARSTVERHQRAGTLRLNYDVEPTQSIALARNRAVALATGDLIAFIDDDEFPAKDWLASLYRAWVRYKSAGILGPVLPYFERRPPAWIIRGKFYERDTHVSGTVLPWTSTRTGNALVIADIVRRNTPPFDPLLGSGGEDRDFFKRMIEMGHTFVWCNEATVFETVPPRRWSRSFMLRRALHRGQNYRTNAARTWATVPTSLVAIVLYGMVLPFTWMAGEHVLMKYLIKLCDHLGKCLAFFGISPIKETYVIN